MICIDDSYRSKIRLPYHSEFDKNREHRRYTLSAPVQQILQTYTLWFKPKFESKQQPHSNLIQSLVFRLFIFMPIILFSLPLIELRIMHHHFLYLTGFLRSPDTVSDVTMTPHTVAACWTMPLQVIERKGSATVCAWRLAWAQQYFLVVWVFFFCVQIWVKMTPPGENQLSAWNSKNILFPHDKSIPFIIFWVIAFW